MRLGTKLAVGAVTAGVALTVYVRRRHQSTGIGYLDIIKQLPSEAQRWATQTRERAATAIEDGRKAARRREAELTRQLEAADPAASPPA